MSALQRVTLLVDLVGGVDQHGVVLDERPPVLPALLVLRVKSSYSGCINPVTVRRHVVHAT